MAQTKPLKYAPGTILRAHDLESASHETDWIVRPDGQVRRWNSSILRGRFREEGRGSSRHCLYRILGRLPPSHMDATAWEDRWRLPADYDPARHDLAWHDKHNWDWTSPGWLDDYHNWTIVQRAGTTPSDAGPPPAPGFEDGRSPEAGPPQRTAPSPHSTTCPSGWTTIQSDGVWIVRPDGQVDRIADPKTTGCDAQSIQKPAAPRQKGPPMFRLLKFAPKVATWLTIGWLAFGSGGETVKNAVVTWWTAPTRLILGDWVQVTTCDACRHVVPTGAPLCRHCGGESFSTRKGQTLHHPTPLGGASSIIRGHAYPDGTVVTDPGNWLVPERPVRRDS